jgi:hypothetical protein
VSILVEIAEKADVPVEGVVRVLTREPVSDAVKERVLAVLDDLTPEQTRAVQRFALAALHDVLLRPGEAESVGGPAPADEQLPALDAGAAVEPGALPATGSDAALVQLSSVLGELAEAVRDLRRETDAERRERVDDLAVLIDLITTGWQGLDTRLGRIERQVSRIEAARREPAIIAPARVAPAAVEPPAPAVPAQPVPVAPSAEPSTHARLPIVAGLALVGAAIATLAVLQLASGGPDVSRLVSSRDTTATATTGLSSTTSAPTTARTETRPAATTARPPAQSRTAPTTTSDVLGTTSAGTPRTKPPVAPTSPKTVSAPPRATTRPATTAAAPRGFEPTRNWAWAPVKSADYYDVVFTKAGKTFYKASPTEPRLTLPGSVVFQAGPYRWVVRPGFGARSAKNLGPAVVDSPFTVS